MQRFTLSMTFAMVLLALAGCAGTPKAASCEGSYRSLNPTQYDLKDTVHADVQPPVH